MNQTPDTPSQQDLQDLREVLRHVGELASAALGLTRDRVEICGTSDDVHQRLHALQFLVDRMGWASDLGLRKLGDSGAMARAEDWMLPAT